MTRNSPLHDQHLELGARFVDFAGWEMPVRYDSVLAEHRAVRSNVGVFDVSHLGRLAVEGPEAAAALQDLFTNDAASLEPGRTHYTLLLNEAGGIIDDILVWRWSEDAFWVLPNAANSDRVANEIRSRGPEVRDLREETVFLAVQGPQAPTIIEKVVGQAPARFRTAVVGDIRMAGTGYTGERGGELCLPTERAADVWARLIEAGCVPCGLAARDTLRLEAGLPLWGSDIDEETSPLEAGLEFAIDWDHDFPGKESLLRQRESGPERRLVGLMTEERVVPRHGYQVRSGDSVGTVTSGNLSPMLDKGIALAYLAPPVETGVPVAIEIRGRWIPGHTVKPPFHR